MTWFKMDDQFPSHPKVLRAGPDAAWLFVAGGCYCSSHLTDGLIPKCAVATLTTLRQPNRLAAKLVDVGLWHDLGDDYEMHDFLDYNPSREKVEKDRAAARERATKGARSSHEVRAKNGRSSDAPVPSRPDVLTEHLSGARKRGARLPDEFEVTPEMVGWVERDCPGVNWRWQTQKFVDHFKSAPGQKGVKTDWERAWRNWMRTEQEKPRR